MKLERWRWEQTGEGGKRSGQRTDAVGRVEGIGRTVDDNGSGGRMNIGIGVWKRGACVIYRLQVEWCKGMDGVLRVQHS